MTQNPVHGEVWLLLGNRAGEVAQQRALASALGRPWREIPVARMAPSGKQVTYDFIALAPPWPRLAISFGKTLGAVKFMQAQGASATCYVHLGLPRKMPIEALDLVVPMPADRYAQAPNVLVIRMPFNPAPSPAVAESATAARLRASGWPRPWTALVIGGSTPRGDVTPAQVMRLAAQANAHALAHGGSLLVSTSPRTPPAVAEALRQMLGAGARATRPLARRAPGELHLYDSSPAAANPYPAYLKLADQFIVTGDSASMIAECWRTGRPLWVAPLSFSPKQRWTRRVRSWVPAALIRSGAISADIDIGRWVRQLAYDGLVGLWGRSDPVRPYRPEDDDDLQRTVARIEALLADGNPAAAGAKARRA